MDSSDIFVRSAKGEQEIATQANKLPIKHRSVLIMINGIMSEHQLLFKLSGMFDGKAIVTDLETHGFIERKAGSKPVIHAVENKVAALSVPAKQYMIDTMYSALGPEADAFVSKIEKCKNNADLDGLAGHCSTTLSGLGKKKKAEEFSVKLRELMG